MVLGFICTSSKFFAFFRPTFSQCSHFFILTAHLLLHLCRMGVDLDALGHGEGMVAFPPHGAQHAMAHLCSGWAALASESHRYEVKKVQSLLGQGTATLAL